ncbi:hypothetical protein [Fundidesulfovibrio putealis]|nr:hypothetical protein [Fundidesulfovibrio putealis]
MERILPGLLLAGLGVAAVLMVLAALASHWRGKELPRDFDFTHYKRIEHK